MELVREPGGRIEVLTAGSSSCPFVPIAAERMTVNSVKIDMSDPAPKRACLADLHRAGKQIVFPALADGHPLRVIVDVPGRSPSQVTLPAI